MQSPLPDLSHRAFLGTAAATPAPPCQQQGKFTQSGETTQFPHVAAATGATARTK